MNQNMANENDDSTTADDSASLGGISLFTPVPQDVWDRALDHAFTDSDADSLEHLLPSPNVEDADSDDWISSAADSESYDAPHEEDSHSFDAAGQGEYDSTSTEDDSDLDF